MVLLSMVFNFHLLHLVMFNYVVSIRLDVASGTTVSNFSLLLVLSATPSTKEAAPKTPSMTLESYGGVYDPSIVTTSALGTLEVIV